MATITASLFTALDGVVDPGVGNWHFPYFNEEMGKAVYGTHDADVGALASTFFGAMSPETRLAAAHAIADRTIGVRGFFEWDSGPEALPPA